MKICSYRSMFFKASDEFKPPWIFEWCKIIIHVPKTVLFSCSFSESETGWKNIHIGRENKIKLMKNGKNNATVLFSITLCHHIINETDSDKERVREWDSVTDWGRGRRENLAVTSFLLLMNDIFYPTLHSFGLQSINLSRMIWP